MLTNILSITLLGRILLITGIVVVFFIITIINLKTKKPEGCENTKSNCSSCLIECIHNTNEELNKDSNEETNR